MHKAIKELVDSTQTFNAARFQDDGTFNIDGLRTMRAFTEAKKIKAEVKAKGQ